jgi:hypothetical protein
MHVTLATQEETENRRITVRGQLMQKVNETKSQPIKAVCGGISLSS